MRKVFKISILVLVAFLIIIISSLYWLNSNKIRSVHHHPDLGLLIADLIFNDVDVISIDYPEGSNWESEHKMIPSSVFQDIDSIKSLPVEWIVNPKEFERWDTVFYGIKNISESRIYYMTWGYPNSRVRLDLFVYRNGVVDTVWFGGFGCATGIYLEPLNSRDSVIGQEINPLRRYPGMYEEIPIDSDFVGLYRELYGDSVGLQFRLATYSLPWSKYEPQMIKSDIFTISTEKVIENWRLSQTTNEN